MPYSQSQKARDYIDSSYEEFGGVPASLQSVLDGATTAINSLIERPEDEKDALLAATALLLSKDMTIYKEAPENIGEYSAQVQQIISDAAERIGNPQLYTASPDLMQIGLALALGAKDQVLSMFNGLKDGIDDIAEEDPRLLKSLLRQIEASVAAQPDISLYFTGEQPKLEAAAKEFVDSVKDVTDDLIAHIRTKTAPAAPKAPSGKTPGKSFDL